jgi:hypothetical protein
MTRTRTCDFTGVFSEGGRYAGCGVSKCSQRRPGKDSNCDRGLLK